MSLSELLKTKGVNLIYKLLSKEEVYIFKNIIGTQSFVHISEKLEIELFKRNKTPITLSDRLINTNYSDLYEIFNNIKLSENFKNVKLKVSISDGKITLRHVEIDSVKYNDSKTLSEYSKLLGIDYIKYLYEGKLSSQQKQEIIDLIKKEEDLISVLDGKKIAFISKRRDSIPTDLNVLIVTDFIDFYRNNHIYVEFSSTTNNSRYCELLEHYVLAYIKENIKAHSELKFDNPNYDITIGLLQLNELVDLFKENKNFIIIFKIILGTFCKKVHRRGLYSNSDLAHINTTIEDINFKIKGLDFVNLIKNNSQL